MGSTSRDGVLSHDESILVSRRIHARLEDEGISQATLAREMGIEPGHLSDYLVTDPGARGRGKRGRRWTNEKLSQVARALHTTVDSLRSSMDVTNHWPWPDASSDPQVLLDLLASKNYADMQTGEIEKIKRIVADWKEEGREVTHEACQTLIESFRASRPKPKKHN